MFAVAVHRGNIRSSVAQKGLSPPIRRIDDRTALLATILTPVGKPTHLNSHLCGSGYSR